MRTHQSRRDCCCSLHRRHRHRRRHRRRRRSIKVLLLLFSEAAAAQRELDVFFSMIVSQRFDVSFRPKRPAKKTESSSPSPTQKLFCCLVCGSMMCTWKSPPLLLSNLDNAAFFRCVSIYTRARDSDESVERRV